MDKRLKTSLIGGILILICIGFLIAGIQQLNGEKKKTVTKEDRATAFNNLAAGKSAQTPPQPEIKQYKKAPENVLEDGKDYQAKFITNMGEFTIDLYESQMPITVNNFVFLSEDNYYDNVTFHRVIDSFMIQGGDPTGTGKGSPGYAIKDEFVEGPTNVRGTIAMANAGPNTGGSQFFINVVDNTRLDWNKQPEQSKHPVFGEVIEGMDVVDAISKVQTGLGDKPVSPVIIENIEILEK